MADDFANLFQALTGNSPLSWQTRLYQKHFVDGALPSVIDIPTGLGKTMVMTIWLIARTRHPDKVPTRLVYVVDRRTVVDQATDLAEEFAYLLSADPANYFAHVEKRKPELAERRQKHTVSLGQLRARLRHDLVVSTLRGQLADNREWSRDPSRPAIIIGTVDLIGSALLFSGYRSSYKRRPLEAGLLGQDSLLVLDEAHLSKPFEKLICAINDDGKFQKDRDGKPQGAPMCVIRMSATTTGNNTNGFKLEESDLTDQTIERRFDAKKRLTIEPSVEKNKLNDAIKSAAIALVRSDAHKGKRIVVFVRAPDDATKIAELIRKHEATKNKPSPYADAVEVLTGTMRGLERDELVERPVFKDRWLNGELDPFDQSNQEPVFLVTTSAGEVGFDLNADHMVCDAAPLDSMIQRLGRINRRGNGVATIQLILAKVPTDKSDMDKACIAASKLLTDGMNVNPKALASFKQSLTPEQLKAASTPEPTTVDLTDILLDAWSMTSITELMPGRPPVAPWLRGIDDELPQTTIAWRAELDLLKNEPKPEKAFKAIFAKHRVRPHESLTTNSYRVVEFLKNATKPKGGRPDLLDIRVVVKLGRGIVTKTVRQLIDDPGILNADPTLILPTMFGGIDQAGMLSHDAIPSSPSPDDPPPPSLDIADADEYEPREDARARVRILIERTTDGWKPLPLPGGKPIPADLNLKSEYDTSTLLFNDLRKTDLRVRVVQPVSFDEEGEPVQSLVMLSPVGDTSKKEDQPLTEHVGAVETEARRIADALELKEDDPVRIALVFAARWHDEGKKARVWQVFAKNPDPDGVPLGKMALSRDPKSLRGHRHEFGSLLRIHHPDRFNTTGCALPDDSDARELALHVIATHHGAGRPHFGEARYDDFTDAERDEIHTESVRRFARLQRKYGWWHLAWLENLLRCADAMASADQESDDDPAESEGAEQ